MYFENIKPCFAMIDFYNIKLEGSCGWCLNILRPYINILKIPNLYSMAYECPTYCVKKGLHTRPRSIL